MRPRDLIVVAAVVLIAGFAAADALRGRAEHEASQAPTTPKQTTPTRLPGPQPQAEAPRGWPLGQLQGALVFTNRGDCRIRVIDLVGGVERPLARFAGNCLIWAPPVSQRLAYGLGPASADGLAPFRIADLGHPNRELGGYRALFAVVLWSQDAQRVAWCGRRRTGFDLEVGGPVRRLPRCPVAYAPDGRIAYATGNRLLVDADALVRTDGGITFAAFAGSRLVVVVDGRSIQVFDGDIPAWAADLPTRLQGRTPILSPNGCAAAFAPIEGTGQIEVRDLGCTGRSPQTFFGRDAAWSPDGEWLAVAQPRAIAFHHMVSPQETIRWPASAVQLAWRVR